MTELLASPKTQLPVLSGFSSRYLTEKKNEKEKEKQGGKMEMGKGGGARKELTD